MKKEIVYTDKYALILSDEEIKVGDWYLRYQTIMRCIKFELSFNEATNKNETIIISDSCGDPYERSREWHKKIIAHLPLSDAPILEGVPLLPSFSRHQEDDVDELAEEWNNKGEFTSAYSFKAGYNKAKEKYKYTEEDLKLAMNYGYVQGDTGFQGVANLDDLLDLIHRKIKKPSRPTHFECEMEKDYRYNDDGERMGFPVHLTSQIKTKPNSQGQVELVGKYFNQ